MRAVAVTRYGAPEVLDVVELPVPTPGPDCLRIKTYAAAVNPADVMLRLGQLDAYLEALEGPYVPGMEVSGLVDEAPAESGFTRGDPVMAFVDPFTPHGGAQAEYVVVPLAHVVAVPDGLDLVAAAGLPMNALTAHQCLALLDLPAGATLAVTGATGALGGFTAQLAHHRGLTVIAAGDDADHDLLRALGVDVVVPRSGGIEAYRRAVPGGVDALVDAAVLGGAALGAVRDGGQVVRCRPAEPATERAITVHTASVLEYEPRREALGELAALAGAGHLTPRTAAVLDPADAWRAHRDLEKGGLRGRQLITFTTDGK
ncbi:NADP-dependent oxidoreductase [Streptomyces hundungensis]|uniref:NADP-dependent oxidoreductase n=1 Tax=Streptomyces hundungensis TaxID=1077946 RepID=UPI00340A8664